MPLVAAVLNVFLPLVKKGREGEGRKREEGRERDRIDRQHGHNEKDETRKSPLSKMGDIEIIMDNNMVNHCW